MIAKLVCHGATRASALDRMAAALAATRIKGLKSNVAFLRHIVDHPAFRAGQVHTGFFDQHKPALVGQSAPSAGAHAAINSSSASSA